MRERAGSGAMAVDVPDGATVDAAMAAALGQMEGERVLPSRLMKAVNGEYVKGDAVLREGDELALIPPVSGGCRGHSFWAVSKRPQVGGGGECPMWTGWTVCRGGEGARGHIF